MRWPSRRVRFFQRVYPPGEEVECTLRLILWYHVTSAFDCGKGKVVLVSVPNVQKTISKRQVSLSLPAIKGLLAGVGTLSYILQSANQYLGRSARASTVR